MIDCDISTNVGGLQVLKYGNIENNLDGQFTEINSIASNIWDGGRSSVALADINSDNKLDMIVGNIAGGIAFFSSDTASNITTSNNFELTKKFQLKNQNQLIFLLKKNLKRS